MGCLCDRGGDDGVLRPEVYVRPGRAGGADLEGGEIEGAKPLADLDEDLVEAAVAERAWTSPIWYKP